MEYYISKRKVIDIRLPMDRFEILKYSILLEEYFKNKIINKILENGLEHCFDKKELDSWLKKVRQKLGLFSKKHGKVKEAIFHCSAKELISLYKLMNWKIKVQLQQETFLKDLISKTSKFSTVLTGNKLIRDLCAHPTLDLEKKLNMLTTFTFLDSKTTNNRKRIDTFYQMVKNNI